MTLNRFLLVIVPSIKEARGNFIGITPENLREDEDEQRSRLSIDLDEESALQAVAVISYGRMIELDRKMAIDAARISADRKLAMADSLILAATLEFDATLWTKNAHFKGLEGVKYIQKVDNENLTHLAPRQIELEK